MFTIPTLLTWFRIAAIPIIVGVHYLPTGWLTQSEQNWVGAGVFMIAGITDWLDGYLARKWKQTSSFGAFLDPVADKLMVSAALIVLVQLGRADAILAFIIIGREVTISALREWMAQAGKAKSVAVSTIGKFKTAAQMISIVALLLWQPLIPGLSTQMVGKFALWLAAILTLWSMFYYLQRAYEELRRESAERRQNPPERRRKITRVS
jgi:cardiolipin synthase (CMP-forming)